MTNTPEINVKRRRRGEKPTKRAEAPVRQDTDETSQPSSGGTSFIPASTAGTGGTSMPSMGKMGTGCGGFIVILIIALYLIFSGGLGGGEQVSEVQPPNEYATEVRQPQTLVATATPRPTKIAAAGQAGQDWLVMLYQNADDQVLEQDVFLDLNEAEKIGSSDRVTIVSQIDRFRGAFEGDGDWHTTRRYLVTQDNNLNIVNSELVDEPGEVNMAAGESLVDFVAWATENYPADRTVLILSDHGLGWPGGWSDPNPGRSDPGKAPLTNYLKGDHLYLSELDQTLAAIQQQNIVQKFDIIGMDACLMSQLEVYSALQPYANYAVASEETEPGLGWAYAGFLDLLVNNPDMSPEQVAANIVETYIEEDQRIVDNNARADYLRQGSQMGGFFGAPSISAAALTNQLEQNITLSAVDLNAFPELIDQFNNFAYSLQNADQSIIASARNYAQSYTSIFGNQVPKSYIDLGHFTLLILKNGKDSTVNKAASGLINALDQIIIAEKHGSSKPGSSGIAIYFPNSTLYRNPYSGPQSYLELADRFANISLWDDFLAYHYLDRAFQPDAADPVLPSSSETTRAPGFGNISISDITASRDEITINQTSELSAEITGQNIGYIYLFAGYYDPRSNSIYVADTDYLESPDTQELNGVYYPVWPEAETFKMNFEWEPVLFSITDGEQSDLALFNPEVYGISGEQAEYFVNGTYTFKESGDQLFAQMHFMDGKLFQIFGFNGTDETGSPAEITPNEGDEFTISQRWVELNDQGGVSRVVTEPGATITFGRAPITWEMVYAAAGKYVVGFLVSDMDGNLTQSYTQITVK